MPGCEKIFIPNLSDDILVRTIRQEASPFVYDSFKMEAGRIGKTDGEETADRLSTIVVDSLDGQAKTEDLARRAYQSRTQFHRLFRTVVEETPAAMRRRLLLERAAYQDRKSVV